MKKIRVPGSSIVSLVLDERATQEKSCVVVRRNTA
jgi:hypothetical protein